ncbi:NAD(P)H-dependent oxidoreductase [Cochleicola gelatinilyticus]|uniref:NAD(P)H-dependent oxidoreductase n=1 Tax=Cochleicola gelatinilyticus TaxID=1763537 RepID=A0A167HJE0_9FLAO|nr:NAD(P)H-dependent oxidoreductase [Cochleicola gelatinilyticus]OAB78671.1 NAD(P)H-dependent oxidoreductase [Cochleicola gelatinilyticus]
MASEIIEKLQWRYATKSFDTSKKLSEEKIQIIKEAFNLTATSYGLQPLKLVVISNQDLKEQLVSLTMQQKQVAEASHVLVFCTETAVTSTYIKEYFDAVEKARDTPRAVLSPFETFLIDSFSGKSQEEINEWAARQAYLAMGNLLTVCALEEIDACPMEGFEAKKYDTFLNLTAQGLQSVLVMAIGYRSQDDFFSSMKKVRRGVEKVVLEMK